jgi:dTDP-4-dehydrorhamnose reductase
VIRSKIGQSSESIKRTIDVNSLFPIALAQHLAQIDARLIQIATDCVFSGETGLRDENAPHDAHDVYGKTKSLGEPTLANALNLRCSIVGPEDPRGTSLMQWVLGQPRGASLKGYVNHLWNGVTTKAFGKAVCGLVETDKIWSGTQHFIPADFVSKFELIQDISIAGGRSDLVIEEFATERQVDMRLATINPIANSQLWTMAGYAKVPSIHELIGEVFNNE